MAEVTPAASNDNLVGSARNLIVKNGQDQVVGGERDNEWTGGVDNCPGGQRDNAPRDCARNATNASMLGLSAPHEAIT